jgi:PAS domain S-box-containing protein|tara:strand:- start:325 stop:1332 length:1008 start_codon:yes stop_codon:yes gene_type:complete
MDHNTYIRNRLVIEGTRIGIWDWHVQTGEIYFNDRWAEIIGYTLEELQPISIETWIKYAHPDDLETSDKLLQAHFEGESEYYDFETRMKHKEGHWIWVHDRGKVFEWDEEGLPLRMCGSHTEITEQKELELNLEKAIAEKNVLLSEVHHRVKNNLQLIQSLAHLKQKEGKVGLKDLEAFINAISSAHQAIYSTERFDKINIKEYLEIIIYPLLVGQNININIESPHLNYEINFLIPLGLIISECLNNTLKYAFLDIEKIKQIEIIITLNDELLTLTYKDNGVGFKASSLKPLEQNNTYGMILMKALAEQINGEIHFHNNKGAQIVLVIKTNSNKT